MRIFALSDIHIDYTENRNWLLGVSREDHTDDVLILAGDVTETTDLMKEAFTVLKERFAEVFYVPGNHDLWIRRNGSIDSLERFNFILRLAEEFEIRTRPASFGALTVVPLFSWYDYTFGQPSAPLLQAWVDFVACKWPEGFDEREINHHFMSLNENSLQEVNRFLITFSHFVPRIDVMPSYIPEHKKYLYPVLGSALLDHQIRKIKPKYHIYGHTHVNRAVDIDGITYINNAFGYPRETRITRKELYEINWLESD